jgi:hypothetical protein
MSKMWTELLAHDPTGGQILAAGIAKSGTAQPARLRLPARRPDIIRTRLHDLYAWSPTLTSPRSTVSPARSRPGGRKRCYFSRPS